MSTHGNEGGRPRHEAPLQDAHHGGRLGALDMVFVLGAIAVTGAAYALGVAPVRAAAIDDGRARAELMRLDTEKRRFAEDYRARRGARDAAAQALEGSVRLVPETEINARRAALAALAEESKIQIQATRPLATLRGKRFDLVPIEIDGVGSATDFAHFSAALRGQMPDTAIRSFELSMNASDSQARFTAQLVWYTLPESVAKAAAKAGSADGGARESADAQRGRAGGADGEGDAGANVGEREPAP